MSRRPNSNARRRAPGNGGERSQGGPLVETGAAPRAGNPPTGGPAPEETPAQAEGPVPAEVVHRGIRWRRPEPGRTYWYNEGYRRWVLWSPGQDAPPLPPGWELRASGPTGPMGGRPPVAASPERTAHNRPAPTIGAGSRECSARAAPPSPATRDRREAAAATSRTAPSPRGGPRGAAAGGKPAPSLGAGERPGLLRYLPENAMARRRPMTSPIRWVPIAIAVTIVAVAVYQATRPPAHATRQDIATAEALKGKCLAQQAAGSGSYSTTPVSCRSASAAVKVVAVVLPTKVVSCPRGAEVARVAKPGFVGEPFECLEPLHRRG